MNNKGKNGTYTSAIQENVLKYNVPTPMHISETNGNICSNNRPINNKGKNRTYVSGIQENVFKYNVPQ